MAFLFISHSPGTENAEGLGITNLRPPHRAPTAGVPGRPGRAIRELVKVGAGARGCRGVLRAFLLAVGLDVGRAGLWRGLAVCGCRSVPDSGGEEPPIPCRDPGPISRAFRFRIPPPMLSR
jgi:hypothetical protein